MNTETKTYEAIDYERAYIALEAGLVQGEHISSLVATHLAPTAVNVRPALKGFFLWLDKLGMKIADNDAAIQTMAMWILEEMIKLGMEGEYTEAQMLAIAAVKVTAWAVLNLDGNGVALVSRAVEQFPDIYEQLRSLQEK